MNRHILIVIALFFSISALAQTKVYLLPTLHGLHKQNPQYNYDTLQAIVQRINPDVVAVEIRSEDIAADTAYLKQNYPMEMWMMRYWQPAATIEGVDWLGTELEGAAIPVNYWKNGSKIKAMQQVLAADTAYQEKLKACKLYVDQRMPVLQKGSLKNIIQGSDAVLVQAYYDCLNSRLRGSQYEELTNFYQERDRHIQQNVGSLLNKHAGKTVVILTGSDHYPYLLEVLKKDRSLTLLQP